MVVDEGRVGGVGGTKMVDVGGSVVVVVSAGGVVVVVVGTVVCAGGDEVAVGGRVVLTEGWVATVPPGGTVPTTVVVESPGAVDDGEVAEVEGPVDVLAGRVVLVGRTVVDDAWVATCCFGELSVPVTNSTSRAARATAAMA